MYFLKEQTYKLKEAGPLKNYRKETTESLENSADLLNNGLETAEEKLMN